MDPPKKEALEPHIQKLYTLGDIFDLSIRYGDILFIISNYLFMPIVVISWFSFLLHEYTWV